MAQPCFGGSPSLPQGNCGGYYYAGFERNRCRPSTARVASSARIVFLTIHSEEQFVEACMAEGASGYVIKTHMKADLIPAILAALIGESYISPFAPT